MAAGAVIGTLWGGAAAAEGFHLKDLRWTGSKPTFPLFHATTSGAFDGEVEIRVATRSDPMRYRPHLAFYRFAAALGSRLVPRTESHAVALPELLTALRRDPVGLQLLREDMAVLNDGTVTVLVTEAVPGGREVDILNGPEVKTWRTWADGRQPVPRDRRALVSGYLETLVLDYLTANTSRNVVTVDADAAAASIHLVDNGGAFAARPDPGVLDVILAELRRATRFSKRLILRLRALDRPTAEAALHGGAFPNWLVASRPLVEMLERRGAILSLVDARVAEFGEPAVLAFP
jgi:hypothetical protein